MAAPSHPNGRKGNLFIVSAPSGAGKTTLCSAVLNHFGDIRYSISHTTRPPRGSEQNGVEYHFTTRAAFIADIDAGMWAEWAEVHGNYYGTSARVLDQTLGDGQDILLDIDVQGAFQIVERYPDAVTIFIMPPDFEALRSRMENRGTDSPEVIARRLENARGEIARKDRYRHIIVNDMLKTAVAEMIAVMARYRQR
ncbi:guanylate kinase [Desulfonema ishimotonii]|uniref:Guanylate kinase n=1 Tax=Desulfonema ishimotonii TaxID=45657 RepID=A0A401G3M0_9BACT|nr:guanylate kinase [Desulfonema ishimotonii]GBC63838.1 guanylate kinase [Desulfonema ishimotonii]